jgi:fatty acid amide hydrolase 2
MDKLLTTSATQLAKMIREKTVTSVEVVKTYIDQANKVNPLLNAIVSDRYELAIADAKEADRKLKADPDQVGPFMGVPCTIKDMLAVKGLPVTAGLVNRKNTIAAEDATAVARLKAAGAIPLGMTNMPVLGLTFETTNKLYGRTNNPYNLNYNPGGSSGGEAAIISAAGSAFGLGTDGGGSIRIPSAFCGIFGHKPSAHLVPNTGTIPAYDNEIASGMVVTGPMTRFSEDLMPLLRVLAGPDGRDSFVENMVLGDETKVKISELIYYYVDHRKIHPDMKKAQDRALDVLRKAGAQVRELSIDRFHHAFDMGVAYFGNIKTRDEIRMLMGGNEPVNYGRELIKGLAHKSDIPFHINLMMFIGGIQEKLIGGRTDKFFQMGRDLRAEMDEVLGSNGVLIFPTLLHPAIRHGEFVKYSFKFWITAIFNVMQNAATAMPMGFSEDGLPVSVQAIAKKGNDHLTIAVARHMESQGYAWVPPKISG